MASVRDTVSGALRKCGVLGAGREPRLADQQDAFSSLQGLYRQWINNGTFGRLHDVIPLSDYTARPGQRVFRNNAAVTQITLPETLARTWWDCCACELHYDTELYQSSTMWDAQTPMDCGVVVISDAFTGQTVDFVYDGHIKKWTALHNLTLDSEAPLSWRDPKGLEAALATQIADEYGRELGPLTMRMAGIYQSALAQRFSSPAQSACGVYV
jgi:hypothetical protein